ncbi:MAG: SpoIIE family protein phosphatase [Methanothrix sp.]
MAGIDGLRGKLLAVLLALALIPLAVLGILSLMEMNKASYDVQSNINSLSTSLNRSALAVVPEDADQVQLAEAKSRQYQEFFLRISSQNELIARYAASSSENESCESIEGIWISPTGSNHSTSERRESSMRALCAPARLMQEIHEADPSMHISYIGTEDGVLAVWPYSNKTLSNAAPFSYKDKPFYEMAKQKKRTIWTGPYSDDKRDDVITVTTPFYRDGKFAGIAGTDVSLYQIYSDLSSLKGRGYPFIMDSSGLIIYKPKNRPENNLKRLFASDSFLDSTDSEIRSLGEEMLKESSGSMVIGLGMGDGYVSFSRIDALGWVLGIAYAAEEMSLPARYIDSGIKDVAGSATSSLDDASKRIRDYVLLFFVLAALSVAAAGWWLTERIEDKLASFIRASDKVSRGNLEVMLSEKGDFADLGVSFNRMVREIRKNIAKAEREAATIGSSSKELSFLEGVKQNLIPDFVPSIEDYEISSLYWPSSTSNFDLYNIEEAEGRIAFALAGVGSDGMHAAMLAIMSRTLIRASPDKLDAAKAISGLNFEINRHASGTNLAAFYAVLDPISHTLEYVNAGFNPPFIVDPGGMVDTLGGGGLALGMLDQIDPKKALIPIQPGDVMVMYSNGVVEAENSSDVHFGVGRLINLVIKNRDRPASEIMLAIEKELLDHSKDTQSASDVTLIILKRSP